MTLDQIKSKLKPNHTRFGQTNSIPRASLSNYLNARFILADEHILKLSKLIGVSAGDLRKSFETEKAAKALYREPLVLRDGYSGPDVCPLARWIVSQWSDAETKAWKLRAVEADHDDFPKLIQQLRQETESRNPPNSPIK